MKDVMTCDGLPGCAEKIGPETPEALIQASLGAQSLLIQGVKGRVIPAVAESPVPLLGLRHRTPDPHAARHPAGD